MCWRPGAKFDVIHARARLYRQIRTFFEERDCLEVDTPLLSPYTNPDPNIASISAGLSGSLRYLQTSPEFAMKRLLAAGSGSIYQICHAFREGEQGAKHRSEFTLLEWYRVGYDYRRLMDEMESLINLLSGRQNQFRRLSYAALFEEFLDLAVFAIELPELREICLQQIPGTDVSQLTFNQCLDLLISLTIAPKMQGYLFVYDYPLSQAALARPSRGNPRVAERFELFFDGLELANGFSELTDVKQQRARFEADNRIREQTGLPQYELDEHLLAALSAGLPDCAGVALGLDRLLMVLSGIDNIDNVIVFSND